MGDVYVLRKQDDSGFAGTALQMDSSGQGSLQIPIGGSGRRGKFLQNIGPLSFIPALAGGYGALRSLAGNDQTDLGTALGSAAMAGITNYSTLNQAVNPINPSFKSLYDRYKLREAEKAAKAGMGQLPEDEMELRNNTSQAPVDNTGNTVAQNLTENPVLPFGFENIPETPMPGQTPDSTGMIEQASQMAQDPSIPFGREAMPTGDITDAQRAVMSQSGSRMMPPTPEQQEAMRRNAQAQNAPQRTLDEFGFSRFG